MTFRSHIARDFDFSLPSNRLLVGLVGVGLIAGLAVWLTGGETTAICAPVHMFLAWALVRELDPDHEATALIAGFGAGLWVLAGFQVVGALTVLGLMLAARVVVRTTGRKPLVSDLVVLGVLTAVISFTVTGWVAGFGLAVAIYVDDRMSGKPSTPGAVTAALGALGASVVATLNQVFPQQMPDIRPLLVVAVGALALVAVIREPEIPTSLVDSRMKTPIGQARLHAGRGLIGVLMFLAAFLVGPDLEAMGPVIIAVTLVLVSNEIERIRRRR